MIVNGKRIGIVTICLIIVLAMYGQNYDNVWLMGYNYDQTDDFIEGVQLSFDNYELSITTTDLVLDMQSASTSISSSTGDLLFYTNGCRIIGEDNSLIENGNTLNPGETYEEFCVNEGSPWREYYPAGKQSVLALPSPLQDSVFYLLHEANEVLEEPNGNIRIVTGPLYYSILDMRSSLDNGYVVEKNVPILDEEFFYGQLTAVKKADGESWWIIKPGKKNVNSYFVFSLSESGLTLENTQSIGVPHQNYGGWANFSTDGRMYARYEPMQDDLFLFDFDRETGLLSNFQQIIIEEEEEWVGGVAFSPSSRFLYVSSFNFIYQYDTWADDIAASRITVAEYEPLGQFIEQNFWGMQLGPDCRMYVYCNSCDVIHVIHNPDEQGLACNFEQGAIQLPWPIFRSQPHFPNYRLGPVGNEGLPCTPVVSVQETILPQIGVKTYPNPTKNQVILLPEGISGEWVLYDGFGRVVLQTHVEDRVSKTVDVANLPSGLYYWTVLGVDIGGKLIKQ